MGGCRPPDLATGRRADDNGAVGNEFAFDGRKAKPDGTNDVDDGAAAEFFAGFSCKFSSRFERRGKKNLVSILSSPVLTFTARHNRREQRLMNPDGIGRSMVKCARHGVFVSPFLIRSGVFIFCISFNFVFSFYEIADAMAINPASAASLRLPRRRRR